MGVLLILCGALVQSFQYVFEEQVMVADELTCITIIDTNIHHILYIHTKYILTTPIIMIQVMVANEEDPTATPTPPLLLIGMEGKICITIIDTIIHHILYIHTKYTLIIHTTPIIMIHTWTVCGAFCSASPSSTL
jgi:hypothetical protein